MRNLLETRTNLALGKAGELRVASELLLRGHKVFIPSVDSGVEIILGSGKTLQVKSARRTDNKTRPNGKDYLFNLRRWDKERKGDKPHRLKDIDYMVFWAVDDDAFFIVPANIVRGRLSVRLTPNITRLNNSKYIKYKDRWDLLERQ